MTQTLEAPTRRDQLAHLAAVLHEIRGDDEPDIIDVSPPMLDTSGGCPICGWPGGFHDQPGPHARTRAEIPAELTWKPGHMPAWQLAENKRREKLIDEWHDLPDDHPAARGTLHAYLGLTWTQYKTWVEGRRSE